MRYHLSCVGLLFGLVVACGSPATEQPAATAPAAPADTARPAPAPPAPVPAAGSYPYSLPPVDETARYPVLQQFVRRVLAACATRRQADLLALVSDSVAVSYGGGISGKAGFVSDFLNGDWHGYEKLQEALWLGGTVRRDSAGWLFATYPYVQDGHLYERTPRLARLELDPFTSYVGLSPRVRVYERPDSTSLLVAQLRYPVLLNRDDAPERPGGWLRVTAPDSSFRGYARARQLYCLANMTLTIEPHGRSFWITSVAPFD